MAYGENEMLGIYVGHRADRKLLGTIRNRLVYDSRIPVHRQVWDIRMGRTRLECDGFDNAVAIEAKLARRLGLQHVSLGELDEDVPRYKEVSQMTPQSDYSVGQRLVLTIPLEYDPITEKTDLIAAECEVLEVVSLGSTGWWLRINYEGGEFAAIESMDGRLVVQAPVGKEAAQHDGHGGLEGCVKPHVAIRGVR